MITFLASVLVSFVGQFNNKADILMERLRTMADGRTSIQLFTEINHATLDAIAFVSFLFKNLSLFAYAEYVTCR